MTRGLREAGASVLGGLITDQTVHSFEIDGLPLIAHSIDGSHTEHLLSDIGSGIGVAQQDFGLGSTHSTAL